MIGAIAGDVIGSFYERNRTKRIDFELLPAGSTFTDDTVLTVAVADALLKGTDYASKLREYGLRYPYAGYGGKFWKWLISKEPSPYGSLGNGSAMRVSPVAYVFDTLREVLEEAKKSAEPTHNHPEGIKGAQAVAMAVFLARKGAGKEEIGYQVSLAFDYDLDTPLYRIRPDYSFDPTCPGSVPQALRAFLESRGYEDAVRLAVSLGGDSDTLASIAGA
ncbi:MAG TPA: ADP-ribosylglycohydrolase family protein, partial [Synergistales bacterium]|nr:ADP-ribosylglycohydrolase family protein [Synergistales bacterium]